MVRVAESGTGGRKEQKLCSLAYYDPVALEILGKVTGWGAEKYEAYNYLKGYNFSWLFNAMMRHMLAFWAGEDNDPESGLPHMAHAMWHAGALVSFVERGIGVDDRPPKRS